MDINPIELTITAQKIAETLDIGRSTLNKYSRSLEDAGYIFIKDERGNRAYTERDIIALRHAISLLNKGVLYDKAMADAAQKYTRNIDLDSVAMGYTNSDQNGVVSTKNADSVAIIADLKQELSSEIINAVNVATESLREENTELKSLVRELVQRLDARDKMIGEMMETQKSIASASEERNSDREKERDEKLSQLLRDMAEVKQQASRSIWSKLFGK